MRNFLILWSGQAASLVGTRLTAFALGVWVFMSTGSVTKFAFISLSTILPGIVFSPLGGALVDRWDRRRTLILSACATGLIILFIAFLIWAGLLEIWHLYLLLGADSVITAFRIPALTASTTLLVEPHQLGRAAGITQIAQSGSMILAPLLGGVLVLKIELWQILLFDFATSLAALSTLSIVRIPQPERSAEGRAGQGTLWRETVYGWSYIRQRPGLFGMMALFTAGFFVFGFVQVLLTPLVLSFASSATLGVVLSVGSSGMLVGAVVMSVWGGPKHRIRAVVAFTALQGTVLLAGGLRPSSVLVATATFSFLFCSPIVISCSQAIWQSKVAADVQGRVFATRRMIETSALPVAVLSAGLLSDHVFEPLLMPGGLLSGSVGRLIGVGPGRGMGLLFMLLGVFHAASAVLAYGYRPLRRVEGELPDVNVKTTPGEPSPVPPSEESPDDVSFSGLPEPSCKEYS